MAVSVVEIFKPDKLPEEFPAAAASDAAVATGIALYEVASVRAGTQAATSD